MHTHTHTHTPAVLLADVRMISYSVGGTGVGVRSSPAASLRAGWTRAAAKRCMMLKPVFSGAASPGMILIYRLLSDLKSTNPDVRPDPAEQTNLRENTFFAAQPLFHKSL